MYGCEVSIFLVILFFITYLLFALQYHYYAGRLDLYLKKHRTDIVSYLSGSDLVEYNKQRVRDPRKINWLYSDIGEEDETIKHYKKKLKRIYKINPSLIAFFCILYLMIILLCIIV